MVESGESLSASDLKRLAEIHVEGIEDSVPSLLGVSYARRFYRFLAESNRETILLERIGGRIASACVVSDGPASVYLRTVCSTLGALAVHGSAAFLSRADFRRFVWSVARDFFGGVEPIPGSEIIYLVTDANLRGRGLGRRLVDRADALFRSRGERGYYVQTVDIPENRAITFYERAGFAPLGRRYERGRCFVLFHKQLARA